MLSLAGPQFCQGLTRRTFGSLRVRGEFIRRLTLLLGLVLVGVTGEGCSSSRAISKVELFVRTAPLPTVVPPGQALAAAERLAATREGDFALQGVGISMEPVYASGTAVVVRPTAFHMLRKGMPVVYANAKGACVAHMLVEKLRGGWLAIGLNNAEPDEILVTKENLLGVVQHAYVSQGQALAAVGVRSSASRGLFLQER